MSNTTPDDAPEPDSFADRVKIERGFGLPPEVAELAAEDIETIGARKPSSDEVEEERIRRAQAEEQQKGH